MMTRLFVFNLPWTADSDALMAYLTDENFSVESVQVIKDKVTLQSKGYAFVEFTNDISAKAAFEAFQAGKLHLGGRRLGANEAHPKAEHTKADELFVLNGAPTLESRLRSMELVGELLIPLSPAEAGAQAFSENAAPDDKTPGSPLPRGKAEETQSPA